MLTIYLPPKVTIISGGFRWGRPPPYGPKFSQFHAVFRKIWQNHMLAPPEGSRPLLQGILDPPLIITQLRGSNIGGMSGMGRYVALYKTWHRPFNPFQGSRWWKLACLNQTDRRTRHPRDSLFYIRTVSSNLAGISFRK